MTDRNSNPHLGKVIEFVCGGRPILLSCRVVQGMSTRIA